MMDGNLDSLHLHLSGWQVIANGLCEAELRDAQKSLRASRSEIGCWLSRIDEVGSRWLSGLWHSCCALSADEPRFAFFQAWERSALFGEIVFRAGYRACCSSEPCEEAIETARLINLFVTSFDGICDEAPDLLPQLLPATNDLFARFPQPPVVKPIACHPAVYLTFEVCLAAATLLAQGLEKFSPESVGNISGAVRDAYAKQLSSLKVEIQKDDEKLVQYRTALSVATFSVSLLAAAVFGKADLTTMARLEASSKPLGALFGWIDDLVDLEEDTFHSRPNMVQAWISNWASNLEQFDVTPDQVSAAIETETLMRWNNLAAKLHDLGLWNIQTEKELHHAALNWLGLTTSHH